MKKHYQNGSKMIGGIPPLLLGIAFLVFPGAETADTRPAEIVAAARGEYGAHAGKPQWIPLSEKNKRPVEVSSPPRSLMASLQPLPGQLGPASERLPQQLFQLPLLLPLAVQFLGPKDLLWRVFNTTDFRLVDFSEESGALRIPLKNWIDTAFELLDRSPPGRLSLAITNLLLNVTHVAYNMTTSYGSVLATQKVSPVRSAAQPAFSVIRKMLTRAISRLLSDLPFLPAFHRALDGDYSWGFLTICRSVCGLGNPGVLKFSVQWAVHSQTLSRLLKVAVNMNLVRLTCSKVWDKTAAGKALQTLLCCSLKKTGNLSVLQGYEIS